MEKAMYLHSNTFDRIEEQCLKRFGARFPDSTCRDKVNNKQDLANLMVMWLEFWMEERPISKSTPSPVVHMKQMICDAKCRHIRDKLRHWGISSDIPNNLLVHINRD